MNKPFVLNIVTAMEAGGAQGAAVRSSRELRARGYRAETWFIYLSTPTYINEEGVRVVFNRKPRLISDYLIVFFRLYLLMIKTRPSAVITYTHYANILGQLVAFLCGISSRVATQRNPVNTYPKLARYLDIALGSMGLYKTNIVVSKAIEHSVGQYPKKYKNRVKVIYNGIDFNEAVIDKNHARILLGMPLDQPLLINVARLVEQKNQIILIELLEQLPNINVAIAGDGRLKKFLEDEARKRGVRDRLFLLGEIPPADICRTFTAGDIFVFPSEYEAFGFAMVEAMASGLPVIASDIPSSREILTADNGELAGIVVDYTDSVGFAIAVNEVLKNGSLANTLISRGKQRAKQFTLSKMIDGYEKAIN